MIIVTVIVIIHDFVFFGTASSANFITYICIYYVYFNDHEKHAQFLETSTIHIRLDKYWSLNKCWWCLMPDFAWINPGG